MPSGASAAARLLRNATARLRYSRAQLSGVRVKGALTGPGGAGSPLAVSVQRPAHGAYPEGAGSPREAPGSDREAGVLINYPSKDQALLFP